LGKVGGSYDFLGYVISRRLVERGEGLGNDKDVAALEVAVRETVEDSLPRGKGSLETLLASTSVEDPTVSLLPQVAPKLVVCGDGQAAACDYYLSHD